MIQTQILKCQSIDKRKTYYKYEPQKKSFTDVLAEVCKSHNIDIRNTNINENLKKEVWEKCVNTEE